MRRKFKGCGIIMPNIGYGSDKKTRYLLPSGGLQTMLHLFVLQELYTLTHFGNLQASTSLSSTTSRTWSF